MPDLCRVAPLASLVLSPLALSLSTCHSHAQSDPADVVVVALPQIERPAELRRNMVWIPPGAFVAGTPVDRIPRIADQEMPGVLVVMHGYYIDVYPDPNEPGAIQTATLTRDEARKRCEAQSKRLCSELEWERACKGPDSTTYEYGDRFRAEVCASGASGVLVPAGSRVACQSAFGAHDMHGGAFEWTDSPWGRGNPRALASVRGGAASPGDVVGRCANAAARNPDSKRADIGFRCCAGDRNDAEVAVEIARAANPFVPLLPNPELAQTLERLLPDDIAAQLPDSGPNAFHVDRLWRWYPIGNEEVLIGAGCGRGSPHGVCGLVLARMIQDKPQRLAFAPSGFWIPLLKLDHDPRTVWLHGLDEKGNFYRRIMWLYGSVGVGDPERGAFKK